jgi:Fic family protein
MKPYIPDDLPLKEIDFRRLFKLAAEANAELARFDGLLQGIVNSELLLAPLLTEEAVQSSKIEGTQATISDVLELEAGVEKSEQLRNDIQEINNYRQAMLFATEYLQTRPITLGFIRQLHQMLMQGVRGAKKSPGKFRERQNYIGPIGCSLEEATFVPPDPNTACANEKLTYLLRVTMLTALLTMTGGGVERNRWICPDVNSYDNAVASAT